MLFAAVVLLSLAASGQSGFAQTLFRDGAPRSVEASAPSTYLGEVRRRTAEIDIGTVATLRSSDSGKLHSPADPLTGLRLNLFPDATIQWSTPSVDSANSERTIWNGGIQDDAHGTVSLVVSNDGTVNGAVTALGRTYRILPSEGKLHTILEIDTAALPFRRDDYLLPTPVREAAASRAASAYVVSATKLRFSATEGDASSSPQTTIVTVSGPPGKFLVRGTPGWLKATWTLEGTGKWRISFTPITVLLAAGDYPATAQIITSTERIPIDISLHVSPPTGNIVDMLIVYTKQAAAKSRHVEADAELAIAMMNASLKKSGARARMRLAGVHIARSYDDRVRYDQIMADLSKGRRGFANVPRLRDALKADLVVAITTNPENCGVGYMNSDPKLLYEMFGFSVVTLDCIAGHAFAHEVGHNLGLDHDRYASKLGKDQDLYNFGYVSLKGRFVTIMGYHDACNAARIRCETIGVFSNPKLRWKGIATGRKVGGPDAADSTRSLNENVGVISNFR